MAKDQWWGNMRLRTSFFIRQLWLERFCAVLKRACHYVFLQLVVFTVVSHLFRWNIDQLQELWELVTSQIVTHYTMTFILFSWEHVFLEFLTWLIYMFWPQCSNGEQLSLQQKKIQDSMSVPSSGEQLSVQQETRLYISSDFLLDGCNHNTLCVIMITTAIMERETLSVKNLVMKWPRTP